VQSPAFAVIGERAGADQFDRAAELGHCAQLFTVYGPRALGHGDVPIRQNYCRGSRSSCSITVTCSATTPPPGPEFGKYQRSRSLSHGLRRSRHCSVNRVWHAWRQSVASYRLSRSRG
jgi:hypothetical protein